MTTQDKPSKRAVESEVPASEIAGYIAFGRLWFLTRTFGRNQGGLRPAGGPR
jgi:hypothetical protein